MDVYRHVLVCFFTHFSLYVVHFKTSKTSYICERREYVPIASQNLSSNKYDKRNSKSRGDPTDWSGNLVKKNHVHRLAIFYYKDEPPSRSQQQSSKHPILVLRFEWICKSNNLTLCPYSRTLEDIKKFSYLRQFMSLGTCIITLQKIPQFANYISNK